MRRLRPVLYIVLSMVTCSAANSEAKSCVIDAAQNGMLPQADLHFKSAKSLDQKIDELEDCAKLYRSGRQPFTTGEWKLSEFYTAVGSAARLNGLQGFYDRWQERHSGSPAPKLLLLQEKIYDAMGSLNIALSSPGKTQAFIANKEAVDAANAKLDAIRNTSKHDPYWYVLKARLLLLTERNDANAKEVLLEGIRHFPEYADLYVASADYFLPKWGGTSVALEAWAREVALETKSVKRAYAYSRIYTHAFRVQYVSDLFTQSRADWGDIKSDGRRMMQDYPVASNIARFTTAACLAGDHEETYRLFALNPKSDYLGYWLSSADQEACLNWAKMPQAKFKNGTVGEWLQGIADRVGALLTFVEHAIYQLIGSILERVGRT